MLCVHLIHNEISYLQVPVNQPVHLEVIIIFTKWVYQSLRHLEPAHVEEELEEGEDWNIEVRHLRDLGVDELSAHEGGEEEGVDCQGDHLGVHQGDGDPVIVQ